MKNALVWVKAVFALVLSVTIVFTFLKVVQRARHKERAALLEYRARTGQLRAEVEAMSARLEDWSRESAALKAAAGEAYVTVTGESVDALKKAAAEADMKASRGKIPVPEGPEPKKQEPAPRDEVAGPPPGILSREELERLRAREQGQAKPDAESGTAGKAPEKAPAGPRPATQPDAGAKPGAEQEQVAEKAAAPETPPDPEAAFREQVLRIVSGAEEAEEYASRARVTRSKALALADEIMAAPRAVVAEKKVRQLAHMVSGLRAEETHVTAGIDSLREAGQAVEETRRQTVEQREQQRLAAEKRRQEAERRALQQKEMAAAREMAVELKPLVKEYRFNEAAQKARNLMAGFQTEPGRKAAAELLDRCERMEEVKKHVIGRLNAGPFAWGWGFGAQAVDVIGADEKSVKLKTGDVFWTGVSMPQMVKFLDYVLDDKNIRPRARGRLYLGAALICADAGAPENVDRYSRAAVDLAAEVQADVDRLLK